MLGQVALGYAPVIDRNRAVTATRLTVFPLRPEVAIDVNDLLGTVATVWPAAGGHVLLNVTGEKLLNDLLRSTPPANVMVEIPAFMACDAANFDAIRQLHSLGNPLLIKGRPTQHMAPDLLSCFKTTIVDLEDDRRVGLNGHESAFGRVMPFLQSGVRTLVDMEESFGRNALGVIGWPTEDPITEIAKPSKNSTQPDLQVIVELIHRVDQQEDRKSVV